MLIMMTSPHILRMTDADSLNDSSIERSPITKEGRLKYVNTTHAVPNIHATILSIVFDFSLII